MGHRVLSRIALCWMFSRSRKSQSEWWCKEGKVTHTHPSQYCNPGKSALDLMFEAIILHPRDEKEEILRSVRIRSHPKESLSAALLCWASRPQPIPVHPRGSSFSWWSSGWNFGQYLPSNSPLPAFAPKSVGSPLQVQANHWPQSAAHPKSQQSPLAILQSHRHPPGT